MAASLLIGSGWAVAFGLWLTARVTASARAERLVRASHELRGPLTAARLGLELACRPDHPVEPILRGVELELLRAGAALEDLVAAPGGLPSGRDPGPVALGALVAGCVVAAAGEAAAHGARLVATDPAAEVTVIGDRVRIVQAVRNLIANALEHGRPHDGNQHVVAVSVRCVQGWARIEVSDRGCGPAEPISVLTARARRGRGRRGRGLAIAASAAQAHGGRLLWAPSSAGARVVLELSAVGAPPAAARRLLLQR